MRLILCEKPAQANDIARVLGIVRKQTGYIETTQGIVSNAIGHLLNTCMPEDYNPAWSVWTNRPIPLIPDKWRMKVDMSPAAEYKRKQLKVLEQLFKQATEVVIACDAGREGELIARELIEHFRFTGKIQRLWLSVLTDDAIKKGFAELRPGKSTENLYEAALARQHIDWMWGLSFTTLISTKLNLFGVDTPVGRVQTPTLAIAVERHLAIQSFKANDYYDFSVEVSNSKGEVVVLKHSPKESDRFTDKAKAQAVIDKIKGKKLPISVDRSPSSEAPPPLFALTQLQTEANRVLGYSASESLEIAQALYEKHKAISYPRSDSQHLGSKQQSDVTAALAALSRARVLTQFPGFDESKMYLRPSAFDDSKLTDHHAIIPTPKIPSLSGKEAALYELIVRRFLQHFSPNSESDVTTLSVTADGMKFSKSGKIYRSLGWKAV